MKLTQPKLLRSLFEQYKEELSSHPAGNRYFTPQRRIPEGRSETSMDVADYLHLQGALIYLTKSRPDIMTAVSFGATHAVDPTWEDFDELIHCLKYLELTADEGLVLRTGRPYGDLELRFYVDAQLSHPCRFQVTPRVLYVVRRNWMLLREVLQTAACINIFISQRGESFAGLDC